MDIYIKNADTVNHTYSGQVITPSQYYLVQKKELFYWRENSTLLVDIANGIAVVARANDGTEDIIDINDGVNYLKQLEQTQKTEAEVGTGGSTNLFEGYQFTATAGQTSIIDHKFTWDFHLHVGTLETQNQHFKDKIKLEIVDVDGYAYPAGTVLKTYVKNYPLEASGKTHFETNKKTEGNLNNFYLRMHYTSIGTTNVEGNVRMRGFDS